MFQYFPLCFSAKEGTWFAFYPINGLLFISCKYFYNWFTFFQKLVCFLLIEYFNMENQNTCYIDIMLSHVVCLVCLVCLVCYLPRPVGASFEISQTLVYIYIFKNLYFFKIYKLNHRYSTVMKKFMDETSTRLEDMKILYKSMKENQVCT